MDADGLVVPGVGAFAACMDGPARGRRATRSSGAGWPVADRCSASASGMQILFERGVEHGVEHRGLRRVAGHGRAAPGARRTAHGVEHRRGAATARRCSPASRTSGSTSCTPTACATWALVTNDRTRPPLVTWAEHGGDRFVAAVENGPLSATQFHPEKSGDAGARLLHNWVRQARCPGWASAGRGHEQGARPAPRGARAGGRHRGGARARPRPRSGSDANVRKRALTSRAPRRRSRPTGVLAARRRRRLGVTLAMVRGPERAGLGDLPRLAACARWC